ncbi:hypothetical protein [Ruegeria sp. AU67]|uniref:hypothetical protein n=1 Tax=Ruegeria sp. AU67 TaxID=2108530 RepID=UPI001356D20A|nr:hypothetical protein [Ruegeria sp. AU67]
MTCSSSAPKGNPPILDIPEPLIALVRLLAREAARSDFATRCNGEDPEVDHG